MGKKITPEEKEALKAERQQERKAEKSFYELIQKAHAKGALVDVKLPEGVTLESILTKVKNPK